MAYAVLSGAALSSAGTTGCALHGASLSLVSPRESNQREGDPDIRTGRPRFAAQNSPPSGFTPGDVVRAGWKFLNGSVGWVTRSLPTGLKSNTPWLGESVLVACGGKCCAVFHPTSRARDSGRAVCRSLALPSACFFLYGRSGDINCPFRRVNGVVVERGERHGCRKSRKGPWMALVRRPSERRRRERTLREAKGRMQGQAFLLTFFATEKSESPNRAKPKVSAHNDAAPSREAAPATTCAPPRPAPVQLRP